MLTMTRTKKASRMHEEQNHEALSFESAHKLDFIHMSQIRYQQLSQKIMKPPTRPVYASNRELPPTTTSMVKLDCSISGYSADREEASIAPPMVTIDLDGGKRPRSVREMNSCPKRQKKSELQFAASSVRADLARAGIELSTINSSVHSTTATGLSINLTGVKLRHSEDIQIPTGSSLSYVGDPYDYEALALACWDCYPNPKTAMKGRKIYGVSQYSDRSTSSVSDTDSEVDDFKMNSQKAMYIPPLLDNIVQSNVQKSPAMKYGPSLRLAVSSLKTFTMSEVLALTNTARIVTLSCDPYSILHVNAAFIRSTGLDSERVVGLPFATVLDEAQPCQILPLEDCMKGNINGNHYTMRLIQEKETSEKLDMGVQVIPVVACKGNTTATISEVTHFAIDFLEIGQDDELRSSHGASIQYPRNIHEADLVVGVVG